MDTRTLKRTVLAMVLVASCPLVAGCPNPGDLSQLALGHLDRAIATLADQSSDWQATLTELQQRLTKDAQTTIANEVTQLVQKGIATTGTRALCTVDFVRTRMKQDLQRIVARLRRIAPPPLQPVVCDVVPNPVNMGSVLGQLEFYGYDLDDSVIRVALTYDGGETSLDTWRALPTNYLMTVNISAAPLCNKENRRVVVRRGGTELSSVLVLRRQCARAPDPDPPRPSQVRSTEYATLAGGVSGVSEDRVFGGQCTSGYVRQECRVERLEGAGSCYSEGTNPRTGEQLGWTSADPRNGACRVHFGINPFQGVRCQIQIIEVGEQIPRQPDPPCPCW